MFLSRLFFMFGFVDPGRREGGGSHDHRGDVRAIRHGAWTGSGEG